MRTRDTAVNENNKNRVYGVCSSVVECLVVAQVVVGAEPARYPTINPGDGIGIHTRFRTKVLRVRVPPGVQIQHVVYDEGLTRIINFIPSIFSMTAGWEFVVTY